MVWWAKELATCAELPARLKAKLGTPGWRSSSALLGTKGNSEQSRPRRPIAFCTFRRRPTMWLSHIFISSHSLQFTYNSKVRES